MSKSNSYAPASVNSQLLVICVLSFVCPLTVLAQESGADFVKSGEVKYGNGDYRRW